MLIFNVTEPGRFVCFADELRTVQDHFKSLDDQELRCSYVEHRKVFVKEVQMVCQPVPITAPSDQMNLACNSMRRLGCYGQSEPFSGTRRS